MAADLGSRPGPALPAVSGARLRARSAELARQLLALPGVGWTVLFFLAPLGLLVVYSFGSVNLLTFKVEFGWTLSKKTVFE